MSIYINITFFNQTFKKYFERKKAYDITINFNGNFFFFGTYIVFYK